MSKGKVVVGMSGGVDSSVCAYLLKKEGYEVIGVTMETWQEEHNKFAIEDAEKVAKTLGIEYHVIDFKDTFKKEVVEYFLEEYNCGRTPNPCVVCNRKVKWEALLKWANEMGADYVATGHYARIDKLPNGRYAVRNSVTAKKDQTYALYNLTQEQLRHTIMPVGEYTKDEIRNLAIDAGLEIANKPDSQDICFVPDNDYASFIKKQTGKESECGNFVDTDGNILGQHKGIIHYTVGQRKGLNLSMGHPVFVVAIRAETNEVVIGNSEDVFAKRLIAHKVNFMGIEGIEGEYRTFAKIRYNHAGAWCTMKMAGEDKVEIIFDEPVRAVTPGQAVVFYDGEYVMGGATILG